MATDFPAATAPLSGSRSTTVLAAGCLGVIFVQALARVVTEDGVLRLDMVREPARTPQWDRRSLADNATLRDAVAELKRRLARWSERDD